MGLFHLPTLHLPYEDGRSPLIAPLLPANDLALLSRLLLRLRNRLTADLAVDHETADLIEEATHALSAVDQDAALLAAAQPCEIDGVLRLRDAWQDAIASKRVAIGDAAGDEILTPTMLVPLLRRASMLKDAALRERYIDSLGALMAMLAGHGEHTVRVGLHATDIPPLQLRYIPLGLGTGLRLWPAARFAIGACVAQWGGLRVAGRTVLELGSGCGAVGLACAALGASSVWLTDIDEAALRLAATNAALNGLEGTVRTARLDMMAGTECTVGAENAQNAENAWGAAGTEGEATPFGMPSTFDLVVAADVVYDWEGRWQEVLGAMARYLGDGADARVLCSFGSGKRSGAARRSVGALERYLGDATHNGGGGGAGLRCVASEEVCIEGLAEGMLLLLLERA